MRQLSGRTQELPGGLRRQQKRNARVGDRSFLLGRSFLHIFLFSLGVQEDFHTNPIQLLTQGRGVEHRNSHSLLIYRFISWQKALVLQSLLHNQFTPTLLQS